MRYRIISEVKNDSEAGSYTAYGIELCTKRAVLQRISDISRSYFKVLRLCLKCNFSKVSEVHFADVVEDYIIEKQIK